jgi:hypothetical protein
MFLFADFEGCWGGGGGRGCWLGLEEAGGSGDGVMLGWRTLGR